MFLPPFISSLLRLILASEKAFVVVALLMFTDPFPLQLTGGIRGLCYYLIYYVTIFFVLVRWKQFIYGVLLGGKLPLALALIAMISVLWSIEPPSTQKFARELLGTTLFAAHFATRYNLKEQVRLLAWMFGIAALLTLFYGLVLRNYGVMQGLHSGAWRGIYLHKNIMSGLMAMSAAIFCLLTRSDIKSRWIPWAGFLLSVFLVLMSQAGGGRVTFLTLMLVMPLYYGLRFRYQFLTYCLIVGVLAGGVTGTLFVDNIDEFFHALNKKSDLSGRVPLWELMMPLIAQHLWLGYGFKAFWLSWRGPSAVIWRNLYWRPLYGHNGYIDLLAELGVLGLSVFLVAFVLTIKRSIGLIRSTKIPESLWPMLFLTVLFLSNLTETRLVVANSIYWVLFVSISLLPSAPPEYGIYEQVE